MALDDLGVKPGEWLIQNAATGAVGKTIAMICQARGINVINVVRRDAGVGELEALGISNNVSTQDPGWMDKVKMFPRLRSDSLCHRQRRGEGKRPADEPARRRGNADVLRHDERWQYGDFLRRPDLQTGQGHRLLGRQALGQTSPADYARMIGELIALASNGQLNLPVEEIYGLEDGAKAPPPAWSRAARARF